MAAISRTTFSNAFSWMKVYEFRWRFHWNLFLCSQLTIFLYIWENGLVPTRWQAVICTNDDNCVPKHICITWSQWVKSRLKLWNGWIATFHSLELDQKYKSPQGCIPNYEYNFSSSPNLLITYGTKTTVTDMSALISRYHLGERGRCN